MAHPGEGTGSPADPEFVDRIVALTGRRQPRLDEQTAGLVLSLQRAANRHRTLFDHRAHTRSGRHLRAFAVLYFVWVVGELTARDLARCLGASRQSVSAVLAGLESDGLVVRERGDPHDRRLLLVRLTDAGERVVAAEFWAQHEVDSAWVALLTPAERGTLRRLLDRLAVASNAAQRRSG